jgi:hypothetical protein
MSDPSSRPPIVVLPPLRDNGITAPPFDDA